jgi:hypothetical protein
MDNASIILLALDQRLDHSVRLILYGRAAPAQVETALTEAVLPELPELREAFAKAKPRVLELARQLEH